MFIGNLEELSQVNHVSDISEVFNKTATCNPPSTTISLNHLTHSTQRTHYTHPSNGFTLAEVLITLGIIGVVAAVTIPVLMVKINDRVNFERHANIAYKVTQAMEQMRAHGKLITYANTDAFVDELQKYLKIQKRCSASNITECWPTETVLDKDGNEYKVSDAKTRKSLLPESTIDDNNVGLILADGASIILTYNKNSEPIDIGTKVTATKLPASNDKQVAYTITPTTSSIDFMTDVNGKKGPNTEGKDIKSFSSAHFAKSGHPCDNGPEGCLWLVPTYSPLNCLPTGSNAGTEEYNKYCSSGYFDTGNNIADDYSAGAKKVCQEAGMTLPTISKLQSIYAVKNQYTGALAPISSNTGWFWTSEEVILNDVRPVGRSVNFNDGEPYNRNKGYQEQVLCVNN